MAQIVFPNDFASQLTLLDDIIKKNTEAGAKSPIVAWLKEKKMDLAAYKTAGDKAQTCEAQKMTYEIVSQTATQQRDVLMKPIFTFFMQAAQSLKKWYKPTYAALKDWGVPITASGRIDYPSSFEERSAMCGTFFTKYASYNGEANPLTAFVTENSIDVPSLQEDLASAITNNTASNTNAKLAENATAQRNKYWADPEAGLRAIGDYLKSVYVTDVRVLGEWGFVVDEGEGKAYSRVTKLAIGETKVLTGIRINSIVTVTGKTGVVLYKGNTIAGDSYPLKPGDKMGMVKGFSTITVVNTSTLETTEIAFELAE